MEVSLFEAMGVTKPSNPGALVEHSKENEEKDELIPIGISEEENLDTIISGDEFDDEDDVPLSLLLFLFVEPFWRF